MPSSRWPTQNKFNGGFKDFLSHNALSWNFPCITDLLLVYYNCQICFYGFSVYANVCVSASIYISCVFSLTIFIFVLFFSYFGLFVFYLFLKMPVYFSMSQKEREGNDIHVGVENWGSTNCKEIIMY